MGVTIENKHQSIDLGYGGFNNIRQKVADLTNKELGDFYRELDQGKFLSGEKSKEFYEEYNIRLNQIDDELNVDVSIINFLYQPDCGGKLTPKECRKIYKVIKNYDDDVLYGYCGRQDCATFKDFKAIVKGCIDKNIQMRWW